MKVTDCIRQELEDQDKADKINVVRNGRVTFVIQDGRLVRTEVSDGWLAKKQQG